MFSLTPFSLERTAFYFQKLTLFDDLVSEMVIATNLIKPINTVMNTGRFREFIKSCGGMLNLCLCLLYPLKVLKVTQALGAYLVNVISIFFIKIQDT